jgi:hypothetical protein
MKVKTSLGSERSLAPDIDFSLSGTKKPETKAKRFNYRSNTNGYDYK